MTTFPTIRELLERGANPNGDEKNLCTPLSVMAQRGYYEGVKVQQSTPVSSSSTVQYYMDRL